MTCLSLSDGPCPCGTPHFPWTVCNPAGLPQIAYRCGDYLAFRDKLLRPLPGETQLTVWQPNAEGDLAVQLVEWWGYLADILTFYNERIANEDYLATALQPDSVNHLVQLLGYRPRPALGSKVTLAGLMTSGARPPVKLLKGLQVQSKPAPGLSPQTFELDADSQLAAPDIISAEVAPQNRFLLAAADAPAGPNTLWLTGKVSSIKPGDRLLLISATATAPAPSLGDYAWISVSAVASSSDPLGQPVTAVRFAPVGSSLPKDAAAADYVLLRSSVSSPLWSFPTSTPSLAITDLTIAHKTRFGGEIALHVSRTTVNLAGLARSLTTGGLFLLDGVGGLAPTPLLVTSYSEEIWYANCGATAPAETPPASPPPPIGIPISTLTGAGVDPGWAANASSVVVRYGFTAVGELAPVLTAADIAFPAGGTTLTPIASGASLPDAEVTVLVEDGDGVGTLGALTPVAGGSALSPSPPQPDLVLSSPIDVMFNPLSFSRGQTVPSEVLGSGNPVVAGQDFKLKKSPVTYFADPASVSGDNFTSTVQVSVNNVLWREVQSFYGQSANAQVFVLREDDAGATHVTFGDGVNGALPATGVNNILATYRYGGGAGAPATDTLTVIKTPQPGLKALRNPLAPTGGADPDDPKRLRSLAPQSVLTFGRAVAKDDYAALALASGADKAIADYVFDLLSQRPKVTLWIAGDGGALASVTQLVRAAAMPGQGLDVQIATPISVDLTLGFLCDALIDAPAIEAALGLAFSDPDTGLFGARAIGIGAVVYDSQIEAACLAVAGVQAVRDIALANSQTGASLARSGLRVGRLPIVRLPPQRCSGRRYDPGAGAYFTLASLSLNPVVAVAS